MVVITIVMCTPTVPDERVKLLSGFNFFNILCLCLFVRGLYEF